MMKKRQVPVFIWLMALLFFAVSQGADLCCADQARWTVMVYMAGENNLTQSLLADLEEMKAVGSTPDVNIVVQADTGFSSALSFSDGFTRRFKVYQGWLQDYPMGYNADMASPRELSSFISWAVSNFPAERYCLVLWDHGLGWVGGGENGEADDDEAMPVRGILQDSGSHSFMSLSELNLALTTAGVKFDLIEFDACLMGMWEVAVSVRDWASFLSFSQASEPATGDPYDRILGDLAASPWMDGKQLSERIVADYLSYYQEDFGMDVSVTKSAVATAPVQELSSGLNHLAALLNASFPQLRDGLLEIRQNVQGYSALPGSTDLVDFLESLGGLDAAGGNIQAQAAYLKALITENLVIEQGFHNSEYTSFLAGSEDLSGSRGISIFLPLGTELVSGELSEYEKVQAVQEAPEWFGFIKRFSQETGLLSEGEAAQGGFLFGVFWSDFGGGYSDADLDLYVIEPDGGIYAPWIGHASPNGYFSLDSRISKTDFEYYTARPVVRKGTYIPVINFMSGGFGSMWQTTALTYFYYVQGAGSDETYQWGPRFMSLLNPAPAQWDDTTIELLSRNYYSDWWIPAGIERYLSRVPEEIKRSFWEKVIEAKKWNMHMHAGKAFTSIN